MSTIEQVIFQTPLYAGFEMPTGELIKAQLIERANINVDGHCIYCERSSTFYRYVNSPLNPKTEGAQNFINSQDGFYYVELCCARDGSHKIHAWFALKGTDGKKVGQIPSLADIANDEASEYRSVLENSDAAELHKAIGLAAHGVGIGSFVYLRRLFERLIYGRFEEFREAEGWKQEDFLKMRMDDKVQHLAGHIPSFLVENKRLYSILSKGIHELSEEECLAAFEPVKLSIKIILEEDKKKKEELALKEKAAAAIQGFKF